MDFRVLTWKGNGNFCPESYREATESSGRMGRREVAIWGRKRKKQNCWPVLVGKKRKI